MPIDTNYQLKPGETTAAYNTRIAAYNASKATPAPAASVAITPAAITKSNVSTAPVVSPIPTPKPAPVTAPAGGGSATGNTPPAPDPKLQADKQQLEALNNEMNLWKQSNPGKDPTPETIASWQKSISGVNSDVKAAGGAGVGTDATKTADKATVSDPGNPGALAPATEKPNPDQPTLVTPQGVPIMSTGSSSTAIPTPNNKPSSNPLLSLAPPTAPSGGGASTSGSSVQSSVKGALSGVNLSNPVDVNNALNKEPAGGTLSKEALENVVDPISRQILTQINNLFDPSTQKATLAKENDSYSAQLGIPALDVSLVNMKAIIDGNDDSVRQEMQKSGGAFTESQVMALTAARNKTLILQYNSLQSLRDSKGQLLDSHMKYYGDDVTQANTRIEKAIGLENTLQAHENTMAVKAQSSYNTIVGQIGFSGLYASMAGNPQRIAEYEQVNNLQPGAMSILAKQDTIKQQQLEIANAKLQQGNVRIQISGGLAAASEAMKWQSTVKSVMSGMFPTNKNPIQNYNASAQSINRIDQAYKILTNNKLKSKGAADLDLIDSYIAIARPGQNLNEAQVQTLLGSKGIKAKWDTESQKIVGSAVLDPATRASIYNLAHHIFDGQKNLATEAVTHVNSSLAKKGIPESAYIQGLDDAANYVDTGSVTAGKPTNFTSHGGNTYNLPY